MTPANPSAETCTGCGCELNECIDSDPNGDMNPSCARCRAEEEHDFDAEPNVSFDRHGNRRVPSSKQGGMPEMPEPAETEQRKVAGTLFIVKRYTADQMQAYGRACYEAGCAGK